jgi:hypothetical protein
VPVEVPHDRGAVLVVPLDDPVQLGLADDGARREFAVVAALGAALFVL